MKTIILIACLVGFISFETVKNNSVGVFEKSVDVGNPKIKGSTLYDKKTNTYTLTGGGYNIWFNRDEFQYAYKKLNGDFTLTANFQFVGEGKEAHRKIGWMVRASLADSDVHISAVDHSDGLTVLQWRVKPGMNMRDPEDEIRASEQKKYAVIQLQRRGNTFTMRVAEKKGDPFVLVGEHEMDNLPAEVLAGIFICAHNPDVKESATVSDVLIEK
jgi:TolB protein